MGDVGAIERQPVCQGKYLKGYNGDGFVLLQGEMAVEVVLEVWLLVHPRYE